MSGAVLTRGPYLLNQHESGVTVRWRTDHSVRHTCILRFGKTFLNLDRAVSAVELPVHFPGFQEWEARLTGLEPGDRYYYAIEADEAVIVGADTEHRFSISNPEQALHRFWLLGDSGSNRPRDGSLETVLASGGVNDAVRVRNGFRLFNRNQPLDGLIMLGDNGYPLGTDEQYQAAFFNLYQADLRKIPLWPCVGNHDLDAAYQYLFLRVCLKNQKTPAIRPIC